MNTLSKLVVFNTIAESQNLENSLTPDEKISIIDEVMLLPFVDGNIDEHAVHNVATNINESSAVAEFLEFAASVTEALEQNGEIELDFALESKLRKGKETEKDKKARLGKKGITDTVKDSAVYQKLVAKIKALYKAQAKKQGIPVDRLKLDKLTI